MYKETNGDSKCQKCSLPFITNEQRTRCFDPYTIKYSSLKPRVKLVSIIISSITCVLVISTMLIFVKYRDTPIVLHANRPMTLLQLLSHFVLTGISLFLILYQPNALSCRITPIITGIFGTIVFSVNIAKTQKLYVIFKSKRIHTASRKRLIGLLDWFMIGTLVLIDICISFILNFKADVSIQNKFYQKTFINEITCSNNIHNVIHLFYVFLIIVANGVQGLRARSLPSHFKETTHLVYTSFVSVILLGSVSGLYFAQKSPAVKNTISLFCIFALSTLNFGLIYFYKLFIIFRRPEEISFCPLF